jgi:hypothetical protein
MNENTIIQSAEENMYVHIRNTGNYSRLRSIDDIKNSKELKLSRVKKNKIESCTLNDAS